MSVSIKPIDGTEQKADYTLSSIPFTYTDWSNSDGSVERNSPPTGATIVSVPRRKKGNQTQFRPHEAPHSPYPKSLIFQRLRRQDKHNRDIWWAYRDDVDLSAGADFDLKIHMMQALGTQLAMDPGLVYKATSKLFKIDVPETGYPTAVVGFCLYVNLFNEAAEAYENRTQPLYWSRSPGKGAMYYPSPDKEDNDEAFQRVADNLIAFYPNVTTRVLQSILQKLQTDSLPSRLGKSTTPMKQEILTS